MKGIRIALPVAAAALLAGGIRAETELERYYAHPTREDASGVIAPWSGGANGPLDLRVRIAADLYKRYPWTEPGKAALQAPHIVFNTHWKISPEGAVSIPPTDRWMCGDLSQRALSIIQGLSAYYAYSGDPLAFIYVPLTVDYILDFCLTGPEHPWPLFPVSTPTRGEAYGRADPRVPNQLDLCACVGSEVLRAHRLTGNPRYLEAAVRWGETIASKCRPDPELPPWGRYVSPEHMAWSDELTSGAVLIVQFLDDLLRLGHRGPGDSIAKARDAGRAFIRENLLPRWTENEVWGRHYWDWENPVLCGIIPWCCEYFLGRPDAFPNWRNDVRNVLALALCRNCVNPDSRGDAYSGAWAIPETSSCCGTSLSYNQYTYAPAFLLYGALAGDEWAREIGRRMIVMASYDSRENGVVLDGLEGKVVAAGEWLNLAHPWPLCQALKAMGYAPEVLAPGGESHILRTASVVTSVVYGKGRIVYETFDALPEAVDVLRLSFAPRSVLAGGKPLERRGDLRANGFTAKDLSGGDVLLTIRHDGAKSVAIEGDDPQESAGASESFSFEGTRVSVLGTVGPDGGLADVFLDGARQLAPMDFFSPTPRREQTVFSRSGLARGRHEVRIVPRGSGNPISKGSKVRIDSILFSTVSREPDLGAGKGPRGAQRMIFGYTGRKDHVDPRGNAWRPGLEFVARTGNGSDAAAASLWTERRCLFVGKTDDPEIYRYGLHGKEFWVNLTAGPGKYRLTLHCADTLTGARQTVRLNGKEVLKDWSVAEAAGGTFQAVRKAFSGVEPDHGIIEVRCAGSGGKEASLQALELEPERDGEPGANSPPSSGDRSARGGPPGGP